MEEFFEDAKGQLGMADYEARSWTSWHHHMSLVALAHLFVTQTRRDVKRQVPDLTLDMAMCLLRAALPRPQLSLEEAGDLVDYYLDRNEQAAKSHRKTWMAKHPNAVPKSDAVELFCRDDGLRRQPAALGVSSIQMISEAFAPVMPAT